MSGSDFEAEEAWLEPHIWVWVWVLLAVILLIAEILTTGLYVLPFAVGAAAAATLEFVRPGSVSSQWIAFIGISSLLFIAIHRIRRTASVPATRDAQESGADGGTTEQVPVQEDERPT